MTSIDYKELYEQKCHENETLKEVNQEWTSQSYTIGEILEDKYFKLPGDTQVSVHKLLGEISDKQNHIDQLEWVKAELEEENKNKQDTIDKYRLELNDKIDIRKNMEKIFQEEIIDMKHQISEQCDMIKTLKKVDKALYEENLKQQQEIGILKEIEKDE